MCFPVCAGRSLRGFNSLPWRCWVLQPMLPLRAIYVPVYDPADPGAPPAPQWLQVSEEPPDGPGADENDGNENGVPDWLDAFNAAVLGGQVVWWQGVTTHIDGQSVSIAGMWMAAPLLDSDNDSLPDSIDDYPADHDNNSIEWAGGAFTYNGVYHAFRSGWYLGSVSSMVTVGTANGVDLKVPESQMSWFDPWATHPEVVFRSWQGVADILINGSHTAIPPVGYWAPVEGNDDADGDGLPDQLDPFPSDAWNNTYFDFGGPLQVFRIDGEARTFEAQHYPGLLGEHDADGDGIPDGADPYPDDQSNNSSYWTGGNRTWVLDGNPVYVPNQWHTNVGDRDNDGLPDDLDPYPDFSGNYTAFEWMGGDFMIDNSNHHFDYGGWIAGDWHDADTDFIPDVFDPYPDDHWNRSDHDGYVFWNGGVWTVSDEPRGFDPGYYYNPSHAWTDSDGDGMPDFADPFPNDANNGNYVPPPPPTFHWTGGTFHIDGIAYTWPEGDYPGQWLDTDGDGLPDSLDYSPSLTDPNTGLLLSYAGDPDNNSWFWPGGTFSVDGQMASVPPLDNGVQAGVWLKKTDNLDTDGDGIPDGYDLFPNDTGNNAGFWWPEVADDPTSGEPGFVTFQIDNQEQHFYRSHFGNDGLNPDGSIRDTDGDGIPDVADVLYPADPYNGNDTDADGIPDAVEALYPAILHLDDPADAAQVRADGVTYLQAYQFNQAYPAYARPLDQMYDQAADSDGDGMPDYWELINGLNLLDPEDAIFTSGTGQTEAEVQAVPPVPNYDGYILNIERYRAHVPAAHHVSTSAEFLAITGQIWEDCVAHQLAEDLSSAESDWDGDGISNRDELLLLGTRPRQLNEVITDPNQSNSGDQISLSRMTAMLTSGVSLGGSQRLPGYTTNLNWGWLLTPCGCGHSYEGVSCEGLRCANVKNQQNCGCHQPVLCACANGIECPHDETCSCSDHCDHRVMDCVCGKTHCPGGTCSNAALGGEGTSGCGCNYALACLCGHPNCPGAACGGATPGGAGTEENCSCSYPPPCACTSTKGCPHDVFCFCSGDCDYRPLTCVCGHEDCPGAGNATLGIAPCGSATPGGDGTHASPGNPGCGCDYRPWSCECGRTGCPGDDTCPGSSPGGEASADCGCHFVPPPLCACENAFCPKGTLCLNAPFCTLATLCGYEPPPDCACGVTNCAGVNCVNASTTPPTSDCGCYVPPPVDCLCGNQACGGTECVNAATPAPTSDCGCGEQQSCGCEGGTKCGCGTTNPPTCKTDGHTSNECKPCECGCSNKCVNNAAGCTDALRCCSCGGDMCGCGKAAKNQCDGSVGAPPTGCTKETPFCKCPCGRPLGDKPNECICRLSETGLTDGVELPSGCGGEGDSSATLRVEMPAAQYVVNGVHLVAQDPGHTWMVVDGATLSYGPGVSPNPTNYSLLLTTGLPGTGTYPITGLATRGRTYKITARIADALKREITKIKQNPPKYSLSNNCASLPLSIMRAQGVSVPSGSGPVSYPGAPQNTTAVTPYHLGNALDPITP